MGSEQFSRQVRGGSDKPLKASDTGAMNTNDYAYGGAENLSDGDYSYAITPGEGRVIKELGIARVTDLAAILIEGPNFTTTLPIEAPIVWDCWDIEEATIYDTEGVGPEISVWWAADSA